MLPFRKWLKHAYLHICLRWNEKLSSCSNKDLQGYHRITSVLVLTIVPSETDVLERFECAAKELSLHLLPNATGQGPLLGVKIAVHIGFDFL